MKLRGGLLGATVIAYNYYIARDLVFYEIYRHKHEGELPVYCIKHEHAIIIMFYITTTPDLLCNKIMEGTV